MSTRPKPLDDPEVRAMVMLAHAFDGLEPHAVSRVIEWAKLRYHDEPSAHYLNVAVMEELVLARQKLGLPQGTSVTIATIGVRNGL